ncbi:phage tail protein [Dokdonia sp.]|uniref:phage tail protein n=1 Tax=Dokdonia sp. TaxID=2024995 RepID=UPI003262EE41
MDNKKSPEEEVIGKFPVGFYFSVSFGDEIDVDFQEISGISKEMNVEDVVGGGENQYKYRLPTGSSSKNLVLKRAIILEGSNLLTWCEECIDGGLLYPIKTQNVSVDLLDKKGIVSMKWVFNNAYPVKYSVSDLKSQESEVLMESIELAYSFFKIHPV